MGRWTAERWIPVLATLLALQVGAAVALAVRADRLGVTLPLSPLIDADLKSIDKLVLDGAMGGDESAGPAKPPAARVELVRKDGHWTLPDSYGAPAADAKVQGLLDKLANARRGQPIGTSEAALRHFKVANDEYERHVVASASGKVVADLWLGSSTALRKTGVRVAPDRARRNARPRADRRHTRRQGAARLEPGSAAAASRAHSDERRRRDLDDLEAQGRQLLRCQGLGQAMVPAAEGRQRAAVDG